MTQQRVIFREGTMPRPVKQVGYGIAIAVNLVLAWVVANLLEWDLVPFLTEDFSKVQPIMITSFLIGAFVNVIYLIYDSDITKKVGDIVISIVGLIVVVRTFTVFPFDLGGPWDWMIRAIMIFTGIAMLIGTIANLVKIGVAVAKGADQAPSS